VVFISIHIFLSGFMRHFSTGGMPAFDPWPAIDQESDRDEGNLSLLRDGVSGGT